MSRDNVSSEHNKATTGGGANEEQEWWNKITEELSKAYEKAIEGEEFKRFQECKLETIPWGKTAKKVASHDKNIIRDMLKNITWQSG